MILRPLLAALLLLAAFAAQGAGYRVIDLMPDYWAFHEQAQGLDEAGQVELFQRMLVERHPQVYAASVIGLSQDKPYASELAARFHRVQQIMAGKTGLMRRLSATIAQDAPRYEAQFLDTFPDLAFSGDVYFMHSMGGFDSSVRRVGGRPALLFGVETIASVYGEDTDPQAFFHHELFHVYRAQFAASGTPSRGALIEGLWDEGLAIYAARVLNPHASDVAIFGLPASMPGRARPRVPELARALRDLLDSQSFDDYARYMLGGPEDRAVPSRSGLFIGYLVAAKLAAKYPLRELAHKPLAQLRPDIEQALDELAAGAPL